MRQAANIPENSAGTEPVLPTRHKFLGSGRARHAPTLPAVAV